MKNKEKIAKDILKILYLSGLLLIVFLANIMVITGITYLLGGQIGYIQLPISLIATLIEIYMFKTKKIKDIVLAIILSAVVILIAGFASSKYYDVYWDSNTYHKDAVGALANGWNPVYEDYITFYKESNYRDMDIIGNKIDKTHGFWQTHYAKGIWYVSANFYYYTGNIEVAKVFNLLITYITFTFALAITHYFTEKKLLSLALATAFSVTPVTMVQMFSYYNDGALYSALLLIVGALILFIKNKEETFKKDLYLWICSSIIIIANIKFTGLAYAGCFCLALYIWYVLENIKAETPKKLIKPTIVFISTLIMSVCIVGCQPYVTNTLHERNPLYPLMGEGKVDIVSYNEPKSFHDKSTFYKFTHSLFAKSANINEKSSKRVDIKMPFTIHKEEMDSLVKSDTRIGGFGVLFSGIFLISCAVCLFGLYTNYKNNKSLFAISTAVIGVCIFLTLFISESWWARYTPFIYFIPLLAIVHLLTGYKTKKYHKYILIILITLMLINVSFYIKGNTYNNYIESKALRTELNKIEKNKESITVVDTYDEFLGFLYNLDDKDIKYDFTTTPSKDDKALFRYLKYKDKNQGE